MTCQFPSRPIRYNRSCPVKLPFPIKDNPHAQPSLQPDRRWYRGNLHMHSTRSDGQLTPAEACALYREQGYDFISLTDHFMENTSSPSPTPRLTAPPGFTTILGAELHAPATSLGDPWHILAVGLPDDFAAAGCRGDWPPTGGTGQNRRCLRGGRPSRLVRPDRSGFALGARRRRLGDRQYHLRRKHRQRGQHLATSIGC